MGLQQVQDVTLIRHAYVVSKSQKQGIGGLLLSHLQGLATSPMLVGTWADATWAIRFYQKHGFQLVCELEKDRLLRKYWAIPERQIETSVVLAAKNSMNRIPKLHDATLETLTLNWEEGTIHLRLSTGANGAGIVILNANGVRGLICPRLFPWGSSDSVNEARLESITDGQLLSIEMQSGDLIQINCRDVSANRDSAQDSTSRVPQFRP
jgi:hypothetical protein